MKIERIDLYQVAMPLVYPFRTAFGNAETIESLLVRMAGEGVEGWGESSPWSPPSYSPEFTGGAFMLIREWLAPALVGKDIATGDQLQEALAFVKGNQFAKAALDLAWWDMHARSQGRPLWQVIGGGGPEVTVGADFGIMETIPALLAEIGKALDAGFERVKLKYRPGWDLDMVRSVRGQFPKATFHVDCNSAYRLDDLPMLKQLDEFGLAMIEQPLSHDDLVDHAELRKQVRTPICLDESVNSPANCAKAIRIGACDWVNIKHGRVGGLTNALAVLATCKAAGVPNWIGGMLESAIGQAFSVALATLDNVKYPSDVFPTDRFYKEDLGDPPLVLSGPSKARAIDAPGIGVKPSPRKLKEFTVRKATIRAK